jgi:4,5-dihydroxyphthalate decarboxylase
MAGIVPAIRGSDLGLVLKTWMPATSAAMTSRDSLPSTANPPRGRFEMISRRRKVRLTLACGEYEITRALIEGDASPDGVDLTVLTEMDASTRNWRFLRKREFDIAELSATSYMIAKELDWPFAAIPVFLHRRFRHGFVFINTKKGIKRPLDLIGRKIGVKSFQVSGIHWMRGILQSEYGVPQNTIEWFSELDEDVEFVPPADLKFTRISDSDSVEAMLVAGELDAVIHSNLIEPFLQGHDSVARLFADHKREEIAYYRKTGIFPIMHVVAIRREIVERHPWLAVNLYQAFDAAKASAMKRMVNPRITPLAWYRQAWEEQQELLGSDPWQYGLTPQNRITIETLARYSLELGLVKRLFSAEDLFLDVSEGRKRGASRI